MSAETKQKAKPDLTQLRDPVALWPDPNDCPDWPYVSMGERRGDLPTREMAEAKLATHIAVMHGEDATLRTPTKAEVDEAVRRYFTVLEPGSRSGKTDLFEALGYAGLNTSSSDNGGFAVRIVESTHIRGWLRKLDASEALNKEMTAGRDQRQVRSRVTAYTGIRDEYLAELERLAEAENRHLQAKADALAHARSVELRRSLRVRFDDAQRAARELGESVPDLPELRYDA